MNSITKNMKVNNLDIALRNPDVRLLIVSTLINGFKIELNPETGIIFTREKTISFRALKITVLIDKVHQDKNGKDYFRALVERKDLDSKAWEPVLDSKVSEIKIAAALIGQ